MRNMFFPTSYSIYSRMALGVDRSMSIADVVSCRCWKRDQDHETHNNVTRAHNTLQRLPTNAQIGGACEVKLLKSEPQQEQAQKGDLVKMSQVPVPAPRVAKALSLTSNCPDRAPVAQSSKRQSTLPIRCFAALRLRRTALPAGPRTDTAPTLLVSHHSHNGAFHGWMLSQQPRRGSDWSLLFATVPEAFILNSSHVAAGDSSQALLSCRWRLKGCCILQAYAYRHSRATSCFLNAVGEERNFMLNADA